MQQITIEDNLAGRLAEFARAKNKSVAEFIDDSLRAVVENESKESDHQKLEEFAASYKQKPQQLEEYDVWQDEQVWED